jgi:uncharacterized membrane protein YhaH (DUF805 family)
MSPFSFQGKIGQRHYALWSLSVLFIEYVLFGIVAHRLLELSDPFWGFVGFSIDAPAELPSTWWLALAYIPVRVVIILLEMWVLGALAFRRAVDADINRWIATLAVVLFLQIPVIGYLCMMPSRAVPARPTIARSSEATAFPLWAAIMLGLGAGVLLTIFSVAMSTLVFGSYRDGLFLLAPFAIGCVTAYLANYKRDIGGWQTVLSVVAATLLGGLALVAVQLEGIVCIIMAAPLGLGAALIGGALGRALALQSRQPASHALSCVAVLPLVFAVESYFPAVTSFETSETITVQAPPTAVWRSLLSTDPIEGPLALPFRLGVAYPLRSEVIGEGEGMVRRGEFSTGTAIEQVTEWLPNRKLSFVVANDIPAMRELSPYQHVHAPHVVGYFRTISTSFELVPRSDGGTDIVERTSHELRIDPIPYWLPMARWIVHQNNARVLQHIRSHAERSARS